MIKKWLHNRKNVNSFKNEHIKELNECDLLNSDINIHEFELRLSEKYQIEPKQMQIISKENRIKSAVTIIKTATADNILTKQEIDIIDKSLTRLELSLDNLPKNIVEELKENYLYYSIENTPLENLVQKNINITLPKTEHCYIQKTGVSWVEQRSVTKRVNYGGVTARVKIVKGLYYTAGSISPSVQKENVWKTLDSGDFYLTNKRLFVIGNKTRNIRLNKILNIELFKDGILIIKDSGNPVLLQGNLNFYALYLMLYRLLDEAS